MKKKFNFILLLFALILTGCSSSKRIGINPQGLLGIEWKLMYVKSAQSSNLLIPTGDKVPTLTFTPDGKSAFGKSGCNHFTGDVKWSGGKLRFGAITGTKMFCKDGMEIENALLKTLQETSGYELDKENLLLKKQGEVLATFAPAR